MPQRSRIEILIKRAQTVLPLSLGIFLTVHGLSGLWMNRYLNAPSLMGYHATETMQAAPWLTMTLGFGVALLVAALAYALARGSKPTGFILGICDGAMVAGILGVLLIVFEFIHIVGYMIASNSSTPPGRLPSMLQWLGMQWPFPSMSMIFFPGFILLLLGLIACVPVGIRAVIIKRSDSTSGQACELCGYLNASQSSQCPECGSKLADSS